jgi:hypothetical protein
MPPLRGWVWGAVIVCGGAARLRGVWRGGSKSPPFAECAKDGAPGGAGFAAWLDCCWRFALDGLVGGCCGKAVAEPPHSKSSRRNGLRRIECAACRAWRVYAREFRTLFASGTNVTRQRRRQAAALQGRLEAWRRWWLRDRFCAGIEVAAGFGIGLLDLS